MAKYSTYAERFAAHTGKAGAMKVRTKRDEHGTRISFAVPVTPVAYDRAGILAAIGTVETVAVKVDCKLGDGLTATQPKVFKGAEVVADIEEYFPATETK